MESEIRENHQVFRRVQLTTDSREFCRASSWTRSAAGLSWRGVLLRYWREEDAPGFA